MSKYADELTKFAITDRNSFCAKAFSRNLGLISPSEQLELSNSTVAIPGMGGVGGLHLITLTRLGIGRFSLADFDAFAVENTNRQYGARVPNLGKSKLETMSQEALSINPFLQLAQFPQGVTEENLDNFLKDVDIVVDSLDFFQFDIRRALFNRAREKGIPVVTAGPIGFSCAMLVFLPGSGLSFDEYFDLRPGLTPQQKSARYLLGLAPDTDYLSYFDTNKINFKENKGPSLGSACAICAGMAATEVASILLKRSGIKAVPYYSSFDPYLQRFKLGRLHWGNRGPLQRLKLFFFARAQAAVAKGSEQLARLLAPAAVPGLSEQTMQQIVEAGIQAPSGDNVQPWKFRCGSDSVSLMLNRESDISFFNFRQYASLIACGAAMENMLIAASAHNLSAQVEIASRLGEEELVATLRFSEGGAAADELYSAIWQRCTNRKMFVRRPLLRSTAEELRNAVKNLKGVEVHLLSSQDELRKLTCLIAAADRVRIGRRDLHEFLMKVIRFSEKKVQTSRDGLPLKNLEAGFAGEWFLKLTRPWVVMNILNQLGISRIVPILAARGMSHCSAALLITVGGRTAADYFLGGRALERVWLTCTRLGLDFQPMTALTIFATRWQLEGGESFLPAYQELLQGIWPKYRELWNLPDYDNRGQVLLARIGSGPQPTARTLRKPVGSFLEK